MNQNEDYYNHNSNDCNESQIMHTHIGVLKRRSCSYTWSEGGRERERENRVSEPAIHVLNVLRLSKGRKFRLDTFQMIQGISEPVSTCYNLREGVSNNQFPYHIIDFPFYQVGTIPESKVGSLTPTFMQFFPLSSRYNTRNPMWVHLPQHSFFLPSSISDTKIGSLIRDRNGFTYPNIVFPYQVQYQRQHLQHISLVLSTIPVLLISPISSHAAPGLRLHPYFLRDGQVTQGARFWQWCATLLASNANRLDVHSSTNNLGQFAFPIFHAFIVVSLFWIF